MKNGSLIYLNRHFQKTTWMMGCEPQPQHPRSPFKVELSSRLSDYMSVLIIEIEGVACTEHSVKVVEVLSRDLALVCKVIVLHVRIILVGDLWRELLK